MTHKSINQKGFAALEALLVLVIAAIVGGTGYYIYHANNKATDSQNAAQTDANSATPHTKDTKKTSVPYTTITEWNVRSPYSGTLKLQYTISADGKQANFTSSQLLAIDAACTADFGGSINRYAPTDDASADSAGKQTAKDRAAKADKSTYAYIDGYYYFFAHSQSGCGADPEKTLDLQQQTNNAVKTLVPKLQAVPKS
jgi:hypothetical protein